jgi:imidazolonepropionase-like amidohydrolase
MNSHSYLIRNARVFDGSRCLDRQDVWIHAGKIAALGADLTIPSEAEIIEGEGRTLLPGLIDSHTHAFFREELRSALVAGVTTELDMFNDPGLVRQIKQEQLMQACPAMADLYSAGTLITVPNGHGTEYGFPIPTITSTGEAQEFVDNRIAEGSDYIKVIYEDGSAWGVPLPSITRQTLEAVVQAAHARGKLVVVHISSLEQAREAVAAGADGLAHLFEDRAADEAFLDLVRASGAFVIPTLTLLENAMGIPSGISLINDPHLAAYISPQDLARLEMTFIPFPGVRNFNFKYALDTVCRLAESGVAVLAGTDAGNPGTAHGVSLHRELELLVAAGLSPQQALTAATSAPAKVFNLSDRGRIAPGLRADLVLVNGDPTSDIKAVRHIERLWQHGREVPRHDLMELARLEHARGPVGAEMGLVSDFREGQIRTRFGFGWLPSTDAIAGGASEVCMKTDNSFEDSDRLLVNGEIHPVLHSPWAGVTFCPGPTPFTPANLSCKKQIRFRARGDGRNYKIGVNFWRHGMRRSSRPFTAGAGWEEMAFPLEEFGTNGSDLLGIFFGTGPESGKFSFEIDAVRFE